MTDETAVIPANAHGPMPAMKILLSPYRLQINKWLFDEGRSLREVERRCKTELNFTVGRRLLNSYATHVREHGVNALPPLPGVIMASRADEAVADMQALSRKARKLLHKRLDEAYTVKTQELVALLKLETEVYGAKNLADVAATETKWQLALKAILRVLTLHTDELTRGRIQTALLKEPDFLAVLEQEDPEDEEEDAAEDGDAGDEEPE